MNTHPAGAHPDVAVLVEDLHVQVSATLTQLADLADLASRLVDSRQTSNTILGPVARAELDQAIVADRHWRRTQPIRDLGLAWLNRETTVAGTGQVRAPGAINAVSATADLWGTLTHSSVWLARRCTAAALYGAQVRPLGDEPTFRDLFARLRNIAHACTDSRALTAVLVDLDHCAETLTRVIDGEDRAYIGDCPHCSHTSLVIDRRAETIACDRPAGEDHHRMCQCSDPFCDCQQKPVSHRHTWWRDPAKAPDRRHTWAALENHLRARRNAAETQAETTGAEQ